MVDDSMMLPMQGLVARSIDYKETTWACQARLARLFCNEKKILPRYKMVLMNTIESRLAQSFDYI